MFTISKGVVHHNPTVEEIGLVSPPLLLSERGGHHADPNSHSDALDLLVNDGFIETTIDPSHYAIRTSHYPTSP